MMEDTLRDLFRGYYQPTDDEVQKIWSHGLIALDTNVLLSLYNVRPTTSALYLGAMEERKPQMWIPYQIASEFHKNVHKERTRQTAAHAARISKIEGLLNDFRSTTKKSRLQPTELQSDAQKALEALRDELEGERKDIAKQMHHTTRDMLLDRIAEVFSTGVGSEPDEAELENMFRDGATRFEQKIPPGYEDEKDKKDNRKYGDYVLWRQMLDYASEQKKDVLFVTDDGKGDWWLKSDDQKKTTLAPRPELIQEFREVTGQDILILNSEQFYYSLVPASDDNTVESAQVRAAQEDMKAAVSEAKKAAAAEEESTDVLDLMQQLKRSLEKKRRVGHFEASSLSVHDRRIWKLSAEKQNEDDPVIRDLKDELFAIEASFDFLEHDAARLHYKMAETAEDDPERGVVLMQLSEARTRMAEATSRKANLEALLRILERDRRED